MPIRMPVVKGMASFPASPMVRSRRDGTLGDLLVTVEVESPKSLVVASRSAIEALRTAAAGHDPRADLLGRGGKVRG